MKFNAEKGIVIAGHRGDPAHHPENTMESFRAAIACGADMIETDVHLTRDGMPVLLHDHDLARTGVGRSASAGRICDLTAAEAAQLNVGTAAQPMQIPTLEELLALTAAAPTLLLDLEIKVYLADEGAARVDEVIEKTVALIEKYHLDGRVLFNSFDAFVLERIHQKYGRRFLLHGYYPYDIMANVQADPASYLDYACYWASGEKAKASCDFLIAHGIAPCTGSHTPEADFFEAARLGCAMFTENDPAAAIRWRDRL